MSTDNNQLDLDLGDTSITGSNSTYSITLDPSIYSMTTSITSPCTITIPNSTCWTTSYGGASYTLGTGISSNAVVKIDNDGISMEEGTDIKIGNVKLAEVLNRLEERLNILHHNEELESKWEELRELGNQYRQLEKDLLEKEKMWKILKDKS